MNLSKPTKITQEPSPNPKQIQPTKQQTKKPKTQKLKQRKATHIFHLCFVYNEVINQANKRKS